MYLNHWVDIHLSEMTLVVKEYSQNQIFPNPSTCICITPCRQNEYKLWTSFITFLISISLTAPVGHSFISIWKKKNVRHRNRRAHVGTRLCDLSTPSIFPVTFVSVGDSRSYWWRCLTVPGRCCCVVLFYTDKANIFFLIGVSEFWFTLTLTSVLLACLVRL